MGDAPGVSIGQAAALFGLAPSTLRWWESQGVLPEPPRVGGRRVYTETDLRRIGLAYLCCITAAMPLDQAAVVVASGSRNRHWQGIVAGHAAVVEERIERLRSAHDYLLHLLRCPDDDIVGECPYLDDELVRRTPRRLVAPPGLVAAARAVHSRDPARRRRDEKGPTRDETTGPSGCAVCAGPVTQPARGRRRKYCSHACRQRHHRQKAGR